MNACMYVSYLLHSSNSHGTGLNEVLQAQVVYALGGENDSCAYCMEGKKNRKRTMMYVWNGIDKNLRRESSLSSPW